jgi:hypothetical protein
MLFEREPLVSGAGATDSDAASAHQLHDIELSAWDHTGLVLVGTERGIDRRQRTDSAGAWFIPLPDADHVAVWRLRRDGERLPRAEVRAAGPVQGVISVLPEAAGPLCAALRQAGSAEELLPTLHDVELQLWDARGWVISGTERLGYGRRLEEPRQSWFVCPIAAAGEQTRAIAQRR